jgi:hypothetical protein
MPDISITFTAPTYSELMTQVAAWLNEHRPEKAEQPKAEQPEAKETKPETKETKPEQTKEPKVEPQQTPSPVTAQELSSFCLALVRKDPNLKPLIKSAILSFGASLIDDLPKESLYDLKLKLEELQ